MQITQQHNENTKQNKTKNPHQGAEHSGSEASAIMWKQ